jgi:hypothetical protein
MKTITLKKDTLCEVCGSTICAGETASVRYDYNWDDPDEDRQGSVQVSFYRHADQESCRHGLAIARLAAEIDAQHEEDQFHKAVY